jgi:hypothetical protein
MHAIADNKHDLQDGTLILRYRLEITHTQNTPDNTMEVKTELYPHNPL